MNIDKNKIIKLLNTSKFHGLVLAEIESCKIKPVNCAECEENKKDNSLLCMGCENNPDLQNNFKPKIKEFWVNEYKKGISVFTDKETALRLTEKYVIREAVHYREVIEE